MPSSRDINGIKTPFGHFNIRIEDGDPPIVKITDRYLIPPPPTKSRSQSKGCGGCGTHEVIWPRLKWQGVPKPVRFWRWLTRQPKVKYKGCGCFIPLLRLKEKLLAPLKQKTPP